MLVTTIHSKGRVSLWWWIFWKCGCFSCICFLITQYMWGYNFKKTKMLWGYWCQGLKIRDDLLYIAAGRVKKLYYTCSTVHTVPIFQDFVGCEPVFTGTVGEYELNLFFTKHLADVDVGDQIDVILTATVSC
jgi:hypothetical protein